MPKYLLKNISLNTTIACRTIRYGLCQPSDGVVFYDDAGGYTGFIIRQTAQTMALSRQYRAFRILILLLTGALLAFAVYAVSAPFELRHFRVVRAAQFMAYRAERFRDARGRYPTRRDIKLGLFDEKKDGPYFDSEDGKSYTVWALVSENGALWVISYDSKRDEWTKYK